MLALDENYLIEIADILRLMGEVNRLKILVACLDKPTSVNDLAKALSLSLPLVSHHLRLMKAMRLVKAHKEGRKVFYCVDDEHVSCILHDVLNHYNHS